MPIVREPDWELFKVKDEGTPLGVGFATGQFVYVGNDEGGLPGLEKYYPIVFNATQIRYLTSEQVEDSLEPVRRMTEAERLRITRGFQRLEKEILRSPMGMLFPRVPIWPPDYKRPAWLPATYQELPVHLVDWAPPVRTGLWMGENWPGRHLYVQRKWMLPLHVPHPEQVGKTLRHEFLEGGLDYLLAREIFPGAGEGRWPGLGKQYGGYSHSIVIGIIEGEDNQARYNIDLALDNLDAGLGPELGG